MGITAWAAVFSVAAPFTPFRVGEGTDCTHAPCASVQPFVVSFEQASSTASQPDGAIVVGDIFKVTGT